MVSGLRSVARSSDSPILAFRAAVVFRLFFLPSGASADVSVGPRPRDA